MSVPATPSPVSGTRFVVAAGAAAVAFVLFLVFVSPTLMQRTVASAPPPAPHEVAFGETAGRSWTATAIRQGDDKPCLRVRMAADSHELCGARRGQGPLQAVRLLDAGDGQALLLAVMSATVGSVTIDGPQPVTLAPVFVDYGYPAGFLAVPVSAGPLDLAALDRDGSVIARATCPATGNCTTTAKATRRGPGSGSDGSTSLRASMDDVD